MSVWIWSGLVLLALVPMLAMSTALLERSGLIRMRHWVEEAGGRLRSLYERPARFEAFRYLLNLLAKVAPLMLFGVLARALQLAGERHPLALAGCVVAAAVAVSELASRRLVRRDSEEALRRMTGLYRVMLFALTPLVLVAAPLVPRAVEHVDSDEPEEEASEEEVEAFIDVGTREGILEPEDRELVWGVVDFGDTQVRSVMTPRVDVVAARLDQPLEQLVRLVVEHAVSRLPLYRESMDQIVGILHIRDLLAGLVHDPRPAAGDLAKPPFLVPETKLLGDLLREFKARHQQMAIVINEWGGTEGVVTVEDLVEEIVGEIQDEYDESEPENRLLADGSLLLDGRAPLEKLEKFFGVEIGGESIETVGGLVSGLAGRVPQQSETFDYAGLRFEIENADDRRVLALRVRRPDASTETGDAS